MKQKFSYFQRNEEGSVIVYVALLMTVFIGFMALSIDTGHWFAVRNELSNAGDASALRGARAYYSDTVSTGTPENINPDPATAQAGAEATIGLNQADTQVLSDLTDLQTGIWNYQTRTLEAWSWPPAFGSFKGPGVTLSTRKEGTVNTGPVNNFFGNIFGINTTNVGTVSAAALSGVGGFYEGTGTFPIAVDEDKVHAAGDIIFFSPDDADVGGWTSLSSEAASASEFKKLINGTKPSPEVVNDDWIKLQNGDACTAIKEVIKTFPMTKDSLNKGVYYPTPPIEVKFPVVIVDKFNQKAQVVGGMVATITEVRDTNAPNDILIPGSSPPKYTGKCMLKLQTKEGVVGGTKGGGAYYGLMSVVPKIVQ